MARPTEATELEFGVAILEADAAEGKAGVDEDAELTGTNGAF